MRIEELTFLRFVAASIVVVFHFGKEWFSGAASSGPEMVTFFFVLSGFVMGVAYSKKGIRVGSYLWARVSRIIPIYLLALFLFLYVNGLFTRGVDMTALLLNAALLQAWVSPYPMSLNSPGWSLSVEAFFYVSFPVIVYVINKYTISASRMMLLALLLWIITQLIVIATMTNGYYAGFPSLSHDLIHYFPMTHLCSFMLGISGAYWYLEKDRETNSPLAVLLAVTAITIIIYALNNKMLIMNTLGVRLAFGSSLMAPLYLWLMLSVALCRSKITGVLRLPIFVVLGEASYSIYILQLPVHRLYEKHISGIFEFDRESDFYLFFMVLTVVSVVTFFVIEKPANKFLRFTVPKMPSAIREGWLISKAKC